MGTGKLLGKPNKLRGNYLRWISIPSRGSRNTPSRFTLQKPGIRSGSYDPLGSKASFFFSTLSDLQSNISEVTYTEDDLVSKTFSVFYHFYYHRG